MNKKEELKPCPFECGNKIYSVDTFEEYGAIKFAVRCECGYSSRYDLSRNAAIERHNFVSEAVRKKLKR